MSNSMSAVLEIKKDAITSLILSLSKYKFVLLIIGAILTMILHSSAGTPSILIGLCASGAMPLEPALYVTLGMNVGTCVTAIVSSIGASTNAKRASMVHLLFNVIGTIIFGLILLIFGDKLMKVIDGLNIPISMKIAIFHTVFNVTTTVLMFPLMKQLTQLASLIIPKSKSKDAPRHPGVGKIVVKGRAAPWIFSQVIKGGIWNLECLTHSSSIFFNLV